MRTPICLVPAVVLGTLLLRGAGIATAQIYLEPIPSYNAQRAYRHFLNSPYRYRTYSGQYPGFTTGEYTPYGYEEYSQGPGYIHERITPRGFEHYQVNPSQERILIPYPREVYVVPPYEYLPWP